MRSLALFFILPSTLLGCARVSPAADADLADAMPWLFANFDGDTEELAEVLVAIEGKTYASLDLDERNEIDRSFEQTMLSDDQLNTITNPGAGTDGMVTMTVAHLSPFDGDSLASIVLMPDQVPVEPYSPDKYDRVFLEGEDCWLARECDTIRTENDLIKKNTLMQVPYIFNKDFRWINLGSDDDPRWSVIARSWMEQSGVGENGKATIVQSYSIEYTIPRDGRGFLLADTELELSENADLDSDGEGTIRMQSLWTETIIEGFNAGDNLVKGTVRTGIGDNYKAADDFLEERASD